MYLHRFALTYNAFDLVVMPAGLFSNVILVGTALVALFADTPIKSVCALLPRGRCQLEAPRLSRPQRTGKCGSSGWVYCYSLKQAHSWWLVPTRMLSGIARSALQ